MVRVFDETTGFGEDCREIREKYPSLVLDTFQLAAMTAIRNGIHPLVTAHTGSGKTLPAEYAIEYFVGEKGKKVIYTAPIKSLSNQKFHEFKAKFPAISFGIMTGDIKFNPDADCVIMTTEILRNSLVNGVFGDDVGCVVFDEVHYINDASRGKVWEECIMWLPSHVIMVLLSATIDRVAKFAEWIEGVKEREVWICSTGKRVVPLIHYSYLTANSGDLKYITDKADRDFVNGFIDTPKIIKGADCSFVERNIVETFRALKMIGRDTVKRSTVIHRVVNYLKENEMLPGICFVFSRRKANEMAKQLNINLLAEESADVSREVLAILRRLPNWEEYVKTAEYEEMIELMQRGIAVHHSGVIPVLREIVEMMFSKGYVRLLFATETFAVGVNMPTKTVLFTDVQKFSENQFRYIHPHEYTQMAGRAGRRGLDKVGHVIHLFNLYDDVGQTVLKNMLVGSPQTLSSKYATDYHSILNAAAEGEYDVVERSLQVALKSMIKYEYDSSLSFIDDRIRGLRYRIGVDAVPEAHERIYCEWLERTKAVGSASKKQKQKLTQELNDFIDNCKRKNAVDINKIVERKKYLIDMEKDLAELCEERMRVEGSLRADAECAYNTLKKYGLVLDSGKLAVPAGLAAKCFNEVDCIVFSVMLRDYRELFDVMSVSELVGYLSLFVVEHEGDIRGTNAEYETIGRFVDVIYDVFSIELSGEKVKYFAQWCDASDDYECKRIIVDSGLYGGEFVKAVLKINNIAQEMVKACEIYGYVSLSKALSEIPAKTLKSIVTAQSLYIAAAG